MRDFRYAARMLGRTPGFTAIAIACLALGFGATTAVYTIVDAVLFRPLQYPDAGRMVRIYSEFPTFPNGGLPRFPVSPPEFRELQRELTSYEALEAWSVGGTNVVTTGSPLRVTATFGSGGLLRLIGQAPQRGRLHTPEDDKEGAPLTAVISHGIWMKVFGGDPNVIGREVKVGGMPASVIGVMPAGFRYPPSQADPSEIWLPLQLTQADLQRRGNHRLSLIGKLRPGISTELARQEIDRKLQAWGQRATRGFHSFHPRFHTIVVNGLQQEVVRTVRPAMIVILCAAGFVLLIACVNVANLLLARAEGRQKEISVRVAMGAGPGGLLKQFVTEGVLLASGGAIAGLMLAYVGVRLLIRYGEESIPRSGEVQLDWRTLLFTMAVLAATAIVFGLAPMVQAKTRDLHQTLKATAGRTSASLQATWLRRGLVVTQLSLALVLLISTALMVKSFWKLAAVDVGFPVSHLMTMRFALQGPQYADIGAARSFASRLEDRLDKLPGATAATLMIGLPPQRNADMNDTTIENFVGRPGGPIENVDFWQITGRGFFATFRPALIEGRYLDARDVEGAPLAAVVNQTMAQTFWPGQSAIGRRIKLPGGSPDWHTIVGVIADMKNAGPDRPTGTELFVPYRQLTGRRPQAFQIAIRTTGDPHAVVAGVRQAVAALDPSIPLAGLRSMEEVIAAVNSRPRFLSVLLSLFTGVALVLAAIGIYGVVSYSVAQRTTEFGVRMAVGAGSAQILGLVLRQGLLLAAFGLAAGLIGSWWLTRFMRAVLYTVEPLDPGAFGAMPLALLGIALFACWFPARRATRVDPIKALRYE